MACGTGTLWEAEHQFTVAQLLMLREGARHSPRAYACHHLVNSLRRKLSSSGETNAAFHGMAHANCTQDVRRIRCSQCGVPAVFRQDRRWSRTPDKAEVHAQAAMLATALQAHEATIAHGRPLRILGVAVNADLHAAQHSR